MLFFWLVKVLTATMVVSCFSIAYAREYGSNFVAVDEVIPNVVLDIRYYTDYNFVGERIDGYDEPVAILTKEAAAALANVNRELNEKGYKIKIFDAYRPQRAVNHFVRWGNNLQDQRMKEYFYPNLDKSLVFSHGYIARRSGHSRGSTIDLTIVDYNTGEDVDMGGTFDYFGELSHPDYAGITTIQKANRKILYDVMIKNGFRGIDTEWWHFTLVNEPYWEYFDFKVQR